MKFIQAKNFKPAARTRIDWIVIHATQGAETRGRADISAARFAGIGQEAPTASAHYIVDPSQVIQTVHEQDVAWHCKSHDGLVNQYGIGIELCGLSEQTAEQWADEASEAEIRLAATLVVGICEHWNIPIVKLSVAEIIKRKRGIAGHRDFTQAFAVAGGHMDPGPNFPWDHFIDLIRKGV